MTDRIAALRLQLMAGELAQQIGARIRQQRIALGLNQTQLAGLINSDAVNNQRVSDWERGVHKPSERYMEQLAEALQRDVSWFYAGDAADQTPDLIGALSENSATQLDRIERKLDALISLLPEEALLAVLEREADRTDAQPERTVAKSRRTGRSRKAS